MDEVKYRVVTGQETRNQQLETGNTLIEVDPRYFRPTEVELLIGDPTKAQKRLGWKPKYDLQRLIEDMVKSDLKHFQRDLDLKEAGHKVLRQAE